MSNITFDVITNTITISKGFYEASKEFGSEEQKRLADIRKEILVCLSDLQPYQTSL